MYKDIINNKALIKKNLVRFMTNQLAYIAVFTIKLERVGKSRRTKTFSDTNSSGRGNIVSSRLTPLQKLRFFIHSEI